jgi:hypothetical protein
MKLKTSTSRGVVRKETAVAGALDIDAPAAASAYTSSMSLAAGDGTYLVTGLIGLFVFIALFAFAVWGAPRLRQALREREGKRQATEGETRVPRDPMD